MGSFFPRASGSSGAALGACAALLVMLAGCSSASTPQPKDELADSLADDDANIPPRIDPHGAPTVVIPTPWPSDVAPLEPIAASSMLYPPAPDRHVAAGLHHTCVRRPNAISCWGANTHGQLGDGTTSDSTTPTNVTGLQDAVSIVAGAAFTCARRVGGTVNCWGNNELGQLGNGTTLANVVPSTVQGLDDAAEVVAGSYHACARTTRGTVRCWGTNRVGQLGDGTLSDRLVPTGVATLTDAVELAAGKGHTCARRATGSVVCWGHNFYGQVGDPTAPNYHVVPFVVPNLNDAVEIAAGHYHTCARRSSGAVSCWGQNLMGQLGDGSTNDHAAPLLVVALADVTQITAGGWHTCARRSSGEVSCWGYNAYGQVGDASFESRTTPVAVTNLTDAVDVIAGRFGHTCARRSTGTLACWGGNLAGEIGDGTTIDRPTPMTVVGLP